MYVGEVETNEHIFSHLVPLIVMSLWSSFSPEYAVMFQNLGFNDIDIFEEVSFHINDILISSTEKDLYLYTLWQDALLEVLLTLSLKHLR